MNVRKALFFLCWGAATLAAAAGFWRIDLWLWEAGVLGCAIAWFVFRRNHASACLFGSICIAAAGLLLGVNPAFIFIYAGLALASWDLASMDLALRGNAADKKENLYHFLRFRSLGLALCAGFVMVFLGRSLNVEFPFLVMAVLVILAAFGFDRLLQINRKKE